MLIVSLLALWLMYSVLARSLPRHTLNCGICGFSGKRPVDETKLRWLLVENQKRGTDSTGVYGNYLYKNNVEAKIFVKDKNFHAAIKGANAVIGHTRAGTFGGKTKENAHPFLFALEGPKDKWACVGGHNGFVAGELLPYYTKKFGFDKPFNVDSEIIFASINKHKNFDIISEMDGGMALGFMMPNADPEAIYLYKRYETRDLHIGLASDGLYYSSLPEPLELIGCTHIEPVEPNVLLTIKHGQIIDRYDLPLPTVKSLPANVKRSDWRDTLTDAERAALPKDVIIPPKSVSTGTTSSYPYTRTRNGGEQAHSKNGSSLIPFPTTPGQREQFSKQYSQIGAINPAPDNPDETIHARVMMLAKDIYEDLKGLYVTPIHFTECESHDSDDNRSCLVAIKIMKAENHHPLMGWSVLVKDSQIAGISAPNGVLVMKIPHQLCDSVLTLLAYDPIDHIGPFEFKLQPTKGRVMEVTLEIPFREEQKEQEIQERDEDSYGLDGVLRGACCDLGGSEEFALYHDGHLQSRWPTDDGGDYTNILPREAESVRRAREGKQSDGDSEERLRPISLPSTEEEHVGNTELMERASKLLPNLPAVTKQMLMGVLTKISSEDGYTYESSQVPESTYLNLGKNPVWENWNEVYRFNFNDEVKARTLMCDALRLQAYDKANHKAWFGIHVYLEMLLLTYKEKYLDKGSMRDYRELLPSTIINGLRNYKEGANVAHLLGNVKWPKDYKLTFPVTSTPKTEEKVEPTDIIYYPDQLAKLAHPIEIMDFVSQLSSKHFNLWLQWCSAPTIALQDMTLGSLERFSETLNKFGYLVNARIKEISDVLQATEGSTTMDDQPLREQLIKNRRYLLNEQEEIQECIQDVEIRMSKLRENMDTIPDDLRM